MLTWLHARTDDIARVLFWTIVFNLAWAIDNSDELRSASDDPLDAPVLTGPKGKALKITSAQKFKVATMASKGDVFKTGQSVVKGMRLMGKKFIAGSKGANQWIDPLAMQFIHRIQMMFRLSDMEIPIISISWGATRLSRMEVLSAIVWSAQRQIAAWCPPQARIV